MDRTEVVFYARREAGPAAGGHRGRGRGSHLDGQAATEAVIGPKGAPAPPLHLPLRALPSAHHSPELTAHTCACVLQLAEGYLLFWCWEAGEIYTIYSGSNPKAIMRAKREFASQFSCLCVDICVNQGSFYVWKG